MLLVGQLYDRNSPRCCRGGGKRLWDVCGKSVVSNLRLAHSHDSYSRIPGGKSPALLFLSTTPTQSQSLQTMKVSQYSLRPDSDGLACPSINLHHTIYPTSCSSFCPAHLFEESLLASGVCVGGNQAATHRFGPLPAAESCEKAASWLLVE
jgi:hypothetical protein